MESSTDTLKYEEKFHSLGFDFVIGIDEAGRGPLAGPVVAAAAALKSPDNKTFSNDKRFNLIRDSKTLSEKQRESLFDFILDNFYIGIGISDHKTIDRINILEATFLAMKKALTSFLKKAEVKLNSRIVLLVDGNKTIPNLSLKQKALISGDKFIKSISAASIVAKVTRDRIMRDMHQKYPEYQFDQHKGYGTKLHLEKITLFGPSEIHRKSFAPLKQSAGLRRVKPARMEME